MSPRNPITLFLCRFVLLYIILVLPWPGWDRIYGAYFRALGRTVFTDNDRRELSFGTCGIDTPNPYYTRIGIVNRALMHEDGSGPVRNLDIDALAFAWKPTALLLALVLATPIPWRRRRWALLWGLLCTHIFILVFLGFCIWNESTEISLVMLTPFWKHFAGALKELMISQYNLVIPVVVWVLVTFRREDRFGSIGLSLFGPATGDRHVALENAAAKMQRQSHKQK